MTNDAALAPNWIDGLGPEAKAAMQRAMVQRQFNRGALIYTRSEAPEGLLVIRNGSALFCLDGASGQRLLLKILRVNDITGESFALDGKPAPVSMEARTDLVTDLIPRHRLNFLRDQFPEISQALANVASANLRATLGYLEELALMPLAERAVSRLKQLCREQPSTTTVGLNISQAELAMMLGASRQAVNLVLAGLEAQGAISRKFRIIECNPSQFKPIRPLA